MNTGRPARRRNRAPDPPESQVRILFGKSGGRCAYPGCGVVLAIPSRSRADQTKSTGKVAHISAASPNGPRFDPSLTPQQRRDETNLILLCPTHHDVVDSQVGYHTVRWLQEAKAQHEAAVRRGYDYAVLAVGFRELELVCDAIVLGVVARGEVAQPVPLVIPAPIQEKVEYNALGSRTEHLIRLGLARQPSVQTYISGVDALVPGFADRLTARMKSVYLQGVADGLDGDAAFSYVLGVTFANCGPALTAQLEAAALAVAVHFLVICEIFRRGRPPQQTRLAS